MNVKAIIVVGVAAAVWFKDDIIAKFSGSAVQPAPTTPPVSTTPAASTTPPVSSGVLPPITDTLISMSTVSDDAAAALGDRVRKTVHEWNWTREQQTGSNPGTDFGQYGINPNLLYSATEYRRMIRQHGLSGALAGLRMIGAAVAAAGRKAR